MEPRRPSHPNALMAGGGPPRASTTSPPSSYPGILRPGSTKPPQLVQSPVAEHTPDIPTPDIDTPSSVDDRRGYFGAQPRTRTHSQAFSPPFVTPVFTPSDSAVSPISENESGGIPRALAAGGSKSRQMSTPAGTNSSARVSQLFGNAPAVGTYSSSQSSRALGGPVTSATSEPKSIAHPSALMPAAPVGAALAHPQAPPPPSFDLDTGYSRASYLQSPQFGEAGKPKRSVSIYKAALGKLGLSGPSVPSTRQYETVDEADEEYYGGHDMSSLEGPMMMRSFDAPEDDAERKARQDRQDWGAAAAEFHQLEAHGELTGGLGGGMAAMTFEFNNDVAKPTAMGSDGRTGPSGGLKRGATVRDIGQREAMERGAMVAVAEIHEHGPDFDMSDFGGVHDGGVQPDGALKPTSANKQSYYFPPDHNMPNWKPFSMRWPYMSLLTLLAFGFAALSEYLLYFSQQLSKQTPPSGLLTFKYVKDVTTAQYFMWKYLPIIVAVLYGVMWVVADFEVKRLEPYYQLSRPGGALAAESLNIDYLTFWSYLSPFLAIRYKQWAVVSCSIATLLASSIVPVLQSASVNVIPKSTFKKPPPANTIKRVVMDPVWTHVMAAAQVLCGILGLMTLWQLRRKSGLLSDPNGIAGVAAMANKSHILMDFKGLDTALPTEIHKRLQHRRYILHKSSLWQGEYLKHAAAPHGKRKLENPHPIMLRLKAGIPFIFYMVGLLAIIPVMIFTKAHIVAVQASWVLTLLATFVKLIWSTIDCDIRMMEPFYILSKRHAGPETLTLDYTGTVPGWMPIKAAKNRHFLVSAVGLGAVLAEVLTVCVSSLGVRGDDFLPHFLQPGGGGPEGTSATSSRANSQETFRSFWTSFLLSLAILIILIGILTAVYITRRHPFLPRAPGTIASVLAFIHQSKMLYDFVDTEMLDEVSMKQRLGDKGKKYGLGWFRGRDGEEHCGVDEEELLTNYRHGEVFGDAVKPWSQTWDVY
ncbi:MAG: hypothetical protein M1814_004935 [Vezdaea aestivalis]|nr:MAG: hypothetical protein M1814_004935 [Vezdaea aestivalis]